MECLGDYRAVLPAEPRTPQPKRIALQDSRQNGDRGREKSRIGPGYGQLGVAAEETVFRYLAGGGWQGRAGSVTALGATTISRLVDPSRLSSALRLNRQLHSPTNQYMRCSPFPGVSPHRPSASNHQTSQQKQTKWAPTRPMPMWLWLTRRRRRPLLLSRRPLPSSRRSATTLCPVLWSTRSVLGRLTRLQWNNCLAMSPARQRQLSVLVSAGYPHERVGLELL
ncbi:hypothetical protein B0T22DRAFT_198166 [Podospora appendiculata]|uniref:Uncharacterized protein n=1 Tax=Podospora appendiculata TaxID=314037 RepID=A0AAE0X475_9PEZI|nr:hypothetical protein B0T22DRAFT_198166 [Podospora appendiculata]